MQPRERQKKFTNLLQHLTNNEAYRLELADPGLSHRLPADSSILAFFSANCGKKKPAETLAEFKSWLGNHPSVDSHVLTALQDAKAGKAANEAVKYGLLRKLMLNPSNAVTQQQIQELRTSIPVHRVQFLENKPYPPVGKWVVESQEIDDMWRKHVEKDRLADSRRPRHEIHMLDCDRLNYDLEPDCSAIFLDEATDEVVMVVMRNFCRNEGILEWVTQIVLENIEVRRNVRKDDSGSLVMAGWSPGSLHKTHFDWVQNFLKKNLPEEIQDGYQTRASSAFALFWNLTRSFGPPDVVEDFEKFVSELGIPAMDAALCGSGPEHQYTVPLNGTDVVFTNAHMAPPQGGFARNYGRWIHFEYQPHVWAGSWTTYRDKSAVGSNFFNASYGIRVQSSPNYACYFKPCHWHGTSLVNRPYSEKGGDLVQCGLALVTSSRLPRAWQKYKEATGAAREKVEEYILEEDSV